MEVIKKKWVCRNNISSTVCSKNICQKVLSQIENKVDQNLIWYKQPL